MQGTSALQAAPSSSMSSAAEQHAAPSIPPFCNLPSRGTLVYHRRPAGRGSRPQIPLSRSNGTPAPALSAILEDGASIQLVGSNFLSLGRASKIGAGHMPMNPSQAATPYTSKSKHASIHLQPNGLDDEASMIENERVATQLQQSARTNCCDSNTTLDLESVVAANTPDAQGQHSQESSGLVGKGSAHDNIQTYQSTPRRSKRKISQIEMQIAGAEETETLSEETPAPKLKTRRKKHRPKVIREDRKAKKQKPLDSTPEGKSPNLKVKRSYVRKKGTASSLEKCSSSVSNQAIPEGTGIAARRTASARRSLHFGLEEQKVQGDHTSTDNSHNHNIEKLVRDRSSFCSVTDSVVPVMDLQNNSSPASTRLPQRCMDALYGSSYIKFMTKKRSHKVRSAEPNLELKNRLSAGSIFHGEHNGPKISEETYRTSSAWTVDDQTGDLDIQCKEPEGRSTSVSTVPYTFYLRGVTSKVQHLDLNTDQVHKTQMSFSLGAPYGDGVVVPYERPLQIVKRPRPRAKVDLDFESTRVWNLLMGSKAEPIDGTDVEKEKWWQQEREVFEGRANSFIACMRLVQGHRRFSPWKGSVVDSVVGVFLTQNVADHLSSSAYMALAATFPARSVSNSKENSSTEDNGQTIGTSDLEGKSMLDLFQNCVRPDPVLNCEEQSVNYKNIHMEPNHSANANELVTGEMYSFDYKTANASVFSRQGAGMEQKVQQVSDFSSVELTTSTEVLQEMQFQTEISSSVDLRNEPIISSTYPNSSSGSASPYVKNSKDEEANSLFIPCDSHVTERSDTKTASGTLNCPKTSTLPAVENDKKTGFEAPDLQEHESLVIDETVTEPTRKEDECSLKSGFTSYSGIHDTEAQAPRTKKTRTTSKKNTENFDWDKLRRQVCREGHAKEKSFERRDSVDWEAVRCADVQRISHAIRERGMNNILAERIQNFLNCLVRDHGSIDLEWLRDLPPELAKDFLLSIRGLGLKSVECVRLLTLHHLAFPVDTNVGRICVRLGWVPIQPLPESLQLHLLELYPILETIQKYLWPRLCKLDQQTLYELHYQMITFGKVFCTKSKPNCNACPLRSECKHFASAFASARLALPSPQDNSLVKSSDQFHFQSSSMQHPISSHLPRLEVNIHAGDFIPNNREPIIEEPASPKKEECAETMENDIEDFDEDGEIPTIKLNMESFAQNLENCIKESNKEPQSDDIRKALVAISSEAAPIPLPKLKNVHRLRTEHYVYELPDSHPLVYQLELDQREFDDPSPYLLAIWTPDEIKEIRNAPKPCCGSKVEGILCNNEMCQTCTAERQNQSTHVRATILVPCRTAMRDSFPLNGTYFQVNEVFADHKSSHNPIHVDRNQIWNLPRRMVFFGTSVTSIFKGLTTEEIQQCFWKGFVCVRGFDREFRAPRPLCPHLHVIARPNNHKMARAEKVH